MRALSFLFLLACAWSYTLSAEARIERFAVIVGNNRGLPEDVELRYAEADARKVADVLQELGGLEPINTTVLLGAQADTLRRTLITVNDRVRAAMSQPDTDVVLFVYYSGHADAEALHLDNSRLSTSEVAELVRGSAASFRLLVLDACRSGQLTRKKGGKVRPPFALDQSATLSGEGLAFLTASAADEDAQESEELRGSFFTHALVSGLLGAADEDESGSVVLEEAYRYAYDATLRSTSRTFHGTQHPTFQYDLRGQGQLVLTETRLLHEGRGTLGVPPGTHALVFQNDARGVVVAEVSASTGARALNLAPGNYFVRVREQAYLLEGSLSIRAGQSSEVDPSRLTRVEYARLVRKGAHEREAAHGVELGGRGRTTLPNAETPCAGGFVGYRLDLPRVLLGARAGYCAARFDSQAVQARVHELDLGLRVGHAWDVSSLTFELGGGGGTSLFLQTFHAQGHAHPRRSLTGYASAFGAILYDLRRGVYLGLDLEAQLYVLRLLDSESDLRAAFAGRAALLVGKHF